MRNQFSDIPMAITDNKKCMNVSIQSGNRTKNNSHLQIILKVNGNVKKQGSRLKLSNKSITNNSYPTAHWNILFNFFFFF